MKIIFDLDGTINDSGEGIINCATLALEYFHLPVPDKQAMRVFVGPPLRETFMKFGVKPENVETAMQIYRKQYVPVGLYQCRAYDGMGELLRKLKADGHRLFIATSKPENMAENVLKHLGLFDYFERICGATLDKSRDTKAEVLRYLLETTGSTEKTVMVGDTVYDVEGAAAFQIPTVGVSWGYGRAEDMEKAGACKIVHTPDELYDFFQ